MNDKIRQLQFELYEKQQDLRKIPLLNEYERFATMDDIDDLCHQIQELTLAEQEKDEIAAFNSQYGKL